ncbi:unnamed protein product [Linum trigynum]
MGRGSSFAIDEEMLALVVPCLSPSLSSSKSGSPKSKRCCNRQASSSRRHPLLAAFTVVVRIWLASCVERIEGRMDVGGEKR